MIGGVNHIPANQLGYHIEITWFGHERNNSCNNFGVFNMKITAYKLGEVSQVSHIYISSTFYSSFLNLRGETPTIFKLLDMHLTCPALKYFTLSFYSLVLFD